MQTGNKHIKMGFNCDWRQMTDKIHLKWEDMAFAAETGS
jgi:hypothetical protein